MPRRTKGQKGFTLMELMVVIVIVAILAAVAVPLYVNYVRDARKTEAKGAIGAVITAQQAYYQRNGAYAPDKAALSDLLDIREAEAGWEFTTAGNGQAGDQAGFSVSATGKSGTPNDGISVTYDFTRAGGGEFDRPQAP
jgi:prepilin-type N-terminal cleavage/methylation domain-containing protein